MSDIVINSVLDTNLVEFVDTVPSLADSNSNRDLDVGYEGILINLAIEGTEWSSNMNII